MDQDYGSHREMRLPQPHGSAVRFIEMNRNQDPINDAIKRIQNPLPADRAERNRRHPRQQDQEAENAAAAELLLESDCQDGRSHDDNNLGKEREDKRIY